MLAQVMARCRFAALLTLPALFLGCGSDDPTCGPGTHEKGGKCVLTTAASTCGAGTVLQGTVCVPAAATLPDAAADATPKQDAGNVDALADNDAFADTKPTGTDAVVLDATVAAIDADDAAHSDVDAVTDAAAPCDPPCEGTATCVNGACELCKPACEFKQCGNDGCEGVCGTCALGKVCLMGQCGAVPADASCKFICGGVTSSGCSCKGDCKSLGTCCADFDQACGCVASCTGKQCGSDGCAGSCGICQAGKLCSGNLCVDDPCQPDPCSGHGACKFGNCTCQPAFVGPSCSKCAPGLVNYPKCAPNKCTGSNKPCNGHGKCAPVDGSCTCNPGFQGDKCDKCIASSAKWPACPNPCAGVNCNDANPCTDDVCSVTGKCMHAANTVKCDDGNPCSTKDRCNGGACIGTKACDLSVNATGDVDDGKCDFGHCSLREAIAFANAAKKVTTIGFPGELAIVLTAPLPIITVPLTIDSLGHEVVVDGNGKFVILRSYKNLKLNGLTLRGGKGFDGGAVQLLQGTLEAKGVSFLGNVAAASGGAVFAPYGAKFTGCTMVANQSKGTGKVHGGGAVYLGGAVEIDRCIFANNKADSNGGAMHAPVGTSGKVLRSTAIGNSAKFGGAFSVPNIKFVNCTMADNTAKTQGGAIATGTHITVLHCTLVGNSAPAGSGVSGVKMTIRNTIIEQGKGGGADCDLKGSTVDASNLIGDGSCKAVIKGGSGTLKLGAWGGSTPTIALAALATPIDAANDAACADKDVMGTDQRGIARPQGKGCDIGAFEWQSDPCAAANGAAANAACNDGDLCTKPDTCKGGSCKPGAKVVCDDGNGCTADACTPWGGCGHSPIAVGCDDGNLCTVGDSCAAGACIPGAAKCNDANACTVDSCDPIKGCSHAVAAGSCSDGDPCTLADTCASGKCNSGTKVCTAPTVSGLAAHYSATVAGAVITDAGGQITTWKDLSGHGRDLKPIAKGPVLDPLGVLGTPAVDFAGDKGLVSQPFGLKAQMSVFVVVRIGKPEPWGCIAHHGDRDYDWSIEQNGVKSNKNIVHFQSIKDDSFGELSLINGNVYVLSARIAGGKRTFSATQTVTVSTSAKGASIAPGKKKLYVGRSDFGEGSNAAIGELLYYDRALSDSERAIVVTYLRAKWRFALPKPDLLWLDASKAKSLQLGKAAEVNKWLDQGGQGHHASSGTVAPSYGKAAGPGGKPAVQFTAATATLQTSPLATTGQMTLVVLAKVAQQKPGGVVFAQDGAATLRQAAGNKPMLQWRIGAGGLGPQVTLKTGVWQVIQAVQDATIATLQVGAGGPVAVTALGAPKKTNLAIGNAPSGGAPMAGSIAELRLFSSALAPLDRAAVAYDCRNRWGL